MQIARVDISLGSRTVRSLAILVSTSLSVADELYRSTTREAPKKIERTTVFSRVGQVSVRSLEIVPVQRTLVCTRA